MTRFERHGRTVVVELEPPATVSTFDPNNVTTLIYDLDTSGGC
jgi:hypothetical protein